MPDQEMSIVVVSGLPRSGTSLMMQMLAAGGIEPLTDGHRTADDDNPRGYYELESVKRLRDDAGILREAPGKAVKVIHALLPHLPKEFAYDIILMNRDLDEVIASQRAMLERTGRAGAALPPPTLKAVFHRQLAEARRSAHELPKVRMIDVSHGDLIREPEQAAAQVAQFLRRDLNQTAMVACVDPALHRHKS